MLQRRRQGVFFFFLWLKVYASRAQPVFLRLQLAVSHGNEVVIYKPVVQMPDSADMEAKVCRIMRGDSEQIQLTRVILFGDRVSSPRILAPKARYDLSVPQPS